MSLSHYGLNIEYSCSVTISVYAHTHTLILTSTLYIILRHDGINPIQDLTICSHTDSLILSHCFHDYEASAALRCVLIQCALCTDQTLIAIGKGLRMLNSLNIRSCPLVTGECISSSDGSLSESVSPCPCVSISPQGLCLSLHLSL